jgi:hypothetical protein
VDKSSPLVLINAWLQAEAAAGQFDVLLVELDPDRAPPKPSRNCERRRRACEGVDHGGGDWIDAAFAVGTPGLAFDKTDSNWNDLAAFFSGLESTQVADTITALVVFEDEFPPESVAVAAPILLNQTSRIPFRPAGLFGLRADMVVGRVVLRLLRRLESPDEIERTVPLILSRTERLSDQFDLLKLVGNRPNVGAKLISTKVETELLSELQSRVKSASADELVHEHGLLLLLYWMNHPTDGKEQTISVPGDPRVFAQLLREALTESRSQSIGSRAVSRRQELHWDVLIEVTGGEDRLRKILPEVTGLGLEDPGLEEAIKLAEQYLSGWRPSFD